MHVLVLAGIGLALWSLLDSGKKTSAPATTSTRTIKLPSATISIPASDDYPERPASDDSLELTQSEQYELANWVPDELYNEAMKSNHKVFVAAAATVLATKGDTRAGDLTLRVANWDR
jgi:hypothetical protein